MVLIYYTCLPALSNHVIINDLAEETDNSYSYVGTYPGIVGTNGGGPGNDIGIGLKRCLINKECKYLTGNLSMNIRCNESVERRIRFSTFIIRDVAYKGLGERLRRGGLGRLSRTSLRSHIILKVELSGSNCDRFIEKLGKV